MDVIIADRLMARGEVVVVNERYGVRISEVTVSYTHLTLPTPPYV